MVAVLLELELILSTGVKVLAADRPQLSLADRTRRRLRRYYISSLDTP